MSTLKVTNIQNADASVVGVKLNPDGTVEIPSLDVDIETHTDVEIDDPQAGQVLVYDAGTGKWQNVPINLDDLDDVDAPTPTDGQALVYDEGAGAWQAGSVAQDLGELDDVTISDPAQSDSLFYDADSGTWVNGPFAGVGLRNADVVVTVGPDGDFGTINDALAFLSTLRTTYKQAVPTPNSGIIRLQPDFEMTEQVLIDGQDFSWVTILSDAGTDPVAITTFDEGTLIPGFEQAQQVQVVVGQFSAGNAGNLDNSYVAIDDGDGTVYYFWFQVERFAQATLDARVRVTDDTPGTSAKEVEVVVGSSGASLDASLVGDTITLTLATTATATQAQGSIFSDDGGVITITADAAGPFDGTAGNLSTEIVDTGSGGLTASVSGGTLTVDLGGLAVEQTVTVAAAIDGISGLSATETTAGNFTAADDLGPNGAITGGTDAGTLDPAQNTAANVAAAIDALSGVSATVLAAGAISTAGTFPLTGGAGQSTDPTPGGATSVEILIDVSFDATQAAAELRDAVAAQATVSTDEYLTGRIVTIVNAAEEAADEPLRVGAFLTATVTIVGRGEGYQTLVNAPGHTFDDGDLITIRGHVGTIQEVDYNGRWTVTESDQGAGTFELDYVADPRSLFSAVRAGVPDTAEAVLPENVPVSRAALTQVWEFFYFPAFGVARGTMPTIGCVFEMDETGPNPYISYKDGLNATDQGRINILPFAGFVNAGGANIYATRSSIINANDAVADGAKGNGIWAYSNSIINARRASATNCGSNGAAEDVGGGFDATGLPVGSAVLAERGSLINAEGVDATGSTGSAFLAQYGGQINVGADPGLAQGTGTSSLGLEYQARGGIIFGVNGDSQGWITPPIIAPEKVVTANTTLELSDRGHVVAFDSTSNLTLTVPLNSEVAFPVGTLINVYRAGTGEVEIVGDTGVTVRNTGSISEQFGEVSLRKRDVNEWVLVGQVDEP